jgi:serine/threonine-protein kinase
VVLWEMLTGKGLFRGGDTVLHTLADVLRAEIDFTKVPATTPGPIRELLRRCLTRDVRKRLRDIGEARIMLESAAVEEAPEVSAPLRSRLGTVATVTAAVLSVVAVVAGFGWWRATRPVERQLMRFSADLGPGAAEGRSITAAISPDGARVAFIARGPEGKEQLATRLLDQAKATLLSGTENAAAPFFSPDGQWIGFFRVLRRWKDEEDLGSRGRCGHAVRRPRRTRRELE